MSTSRTAALATATRRGKGDRSQFAGTALRVLRTNWTCPFSRRTAAATRRTPARAAPILEWLCSRDSRSLRPGDQEDRLAASRPPKSWASNESRRCPRLTYSRRIALIGPPVPRAGGKHGTTWWWPLSNTIFTAHGRGQNGPKHERLSQVRTGSETAERHCSVPTSRGDDTGCTPDGQGLL